MIYFQKLYKYFFKMTSILQIFRKSITTCLLPCPVSHSFCVPAVQQNTSSYDPSERERTLHNRDLEVASGVAHVVHVAQEAGDWDLADGLAEEELLDGGLADGAQAGHEQ